MNIEFDDIEIALADFKLGIPLVVVDDEKRENEGDIIFPAASATSEKINFCVTHARGLVCVAISTSIASRLQLNKVPSNQSDVFGTAFLDSIDATPAFGVTTGISAFDRATTAKQIANPTSTKSDFSCPGHLFPLLANSNGVLARKGHTEAGVDLCKLTNQPEAAVICEILAEDGTMLRREGLKSFAMAHGLKIISIEQIYEYRLKREGSCELISTVNLPTPFGVFTTQAFKNTLSGIEHLVLSVTSNQLATPIVRIHSECMTGDIFGSERCDCGQQLHTALKEIQLNGHGYLIYMRGHEGRGIGIGNKLSAYSLQDKGYDTYEANVLLGFEPDSRRYADAVYILRKLNVDHFSFFTGNPEKIDILKKEGFSFKVLSYPSRENNYNSQYLHTKIMQGGHQLTLTK